MVNQTKGWGICITCRFRSACLPFKNGLEAQKTIWDCSDYEHNDPTNANEGISLVATENHPPGIPSGLCMNCINSGTCVFEAKGSDVVYCEEHSS